MIVLRDRPEGGIETLMLRRAQRAGDFRSGVAVFPGGALDPQDRQAHAHVLGWNDDEASDRLGVPAGGLDYLVAAARECFEEVGLLFAPTLDAAALAVAHDEWRTPMQRGERTVAALCDAIARPLDLRDWAYLSHWVTPLGMPKRFDTRFFVARAPEAQVAIADAQEAESLLWITPDDALDPARGLTLLPVTHTLLGLLSRFTAVDDLLAHARQLRDIPMIMPRLARAAGRPAVIVPGEAAFDEIGAIDPTGRGDAHADLLAGRVVRLSPRILRVTAPNPGLMTGAGTNSYLVGDPETNRWTVIDPGPDDAAHLAALLAAAPGPIERILVTHTHPDHSPGAGALAHATGAPVLGQRPRHPEWQDGAFAPTRELFGGEQIILGPSTTLEVIHTPGHASNHLCYRLVEERLLFSGDHLMQGATVVIAPPDGDMAAYLQALNAVDALDLAWLAPGHGFLMARPREVVEAVRRHRLAREARVLAALQRLASGTLDALLPAAYPDTPSALQDVARLSLLAHLIKLEHDGQARREGDRWAAAGSSMPA